MQRISHICVRCGRDLARQRAVPDVHYGLPVVTCPGCGWASIRRRHVLSRWWLGGWRLASTLAVLLLQHVSFATLLGLTVAGAAGMAWLADGHWSREHVEPDPWVIVAAAGLLCPVLAGTWLTAGLAHWRRRTAWITWASLVAAGITIWFSIGLVVDYQKAAWQDGITSWSEYLGDAGRVRDVVIRPWLGALAMMLVLLPVTALGIPLGSGLLAANRRVGRAYRARRRRRRRLALPVFP